MSHVLVETAEEDVADLQFPKEIKKPNVCGICCMMINEPYITCAECKQTNQSTPEGRYNICLKCFATGAESGNHLNNHSYVIIHNNVKVFLNTSWSAREEKTLIELLIQYGFANWSDIANKIGRRSAMECRDHYTQHYFDGIFWRICQLSNHLCGRIDVPFLYRSNSLDPPRKSDSAQNKLMADYQFARSQFDTPFDVSAESVISDIHLDQWSDDEFEHLDAKLNCALVNAYTNRLRERHRRHRVVRTHGLIMPNRTKTWLMKHMKATSLINKTDTHLHTGRFVAFMQLTSGIEFDRIVEALQYEYDLRIFLNRLYELRTKGITTSYGGRFYHNSKINHEVKSNPSSLWEWKHFSMDINDSRTGKEQIVKHCMELNQLPQKRRSTPLNIIGLANYDRLGKDEKELCSTVRIIPDAFLTYKKLLIAENSKLGYLRLADARRLIKIDVNKTRVMYDFFSDHGYINKPY